MFYFFLCDFFFLEDKKSLIDTGSRTHAQLLAEAHVRVKLGGISVEAVADRIAVQPSYERAFELCTKAAVTGN